MKSAKDPIYTFLRRASSQTEDEKLELVEEIEKNYNFSKLIKEDFKKIKDRGQFNDSSQFYSNIANRKMSNSWKNVLENLTRFVIRSVGDSKPEINTTGWRKKFKKRLQMERFQWKIQETELRYFIFVTFYVFLFIF